MIALSDAFSRVMPAPEDDGPVRDSGPEGIVAD
jgi:hypothetical protein